MQEKTLSIIKPDAVERGLTEVINQIFSSSGLKIIVQKELLLTCQQVEAFYGEHIKKSFFYIIRDFMTSGPVIVQILEGENAILLNRNIMGHTDPIKAEKGTIRAEFGISIDSNAIHGSDSLASAQREIKFFFPEITVE